MANEYVRSLLRIKQLIERVEGATIILGFDNDGKAITKIPRTRELFNTYLPNVEVRVALIGELKDA